MENILETILIEDVREFIRSLNAGNREKIYSAIDALGNRKFDTIYVKQIYAEIKELRVKKYRLLFFVINNKAYFVKIFIKKSNKTPKKEIEFAKKYYKLFKE